MARVKTRSVFYVQRGEYFYTFDNGDQLWSSHYFEVGELVNLYDKS